MSHRGLERSSFKFLLLLPCCLIVTETFGQFMVSQGMKKQKLLREDILPAMASNRKVQRLLNEFMDLLSEYETNGTNADHMDVDGQTNDANI